MSGGMKKMSIFFFNDTATTEIYTLSLHDALPIWTRRRARGGQRGAACGWWCGCRARGTCSASSREADYVRGGAEPPPARDRKSTRLNSSHANISYAVFCLKKKTLPLCFSRHSQYV